jgi:formylmethanofuran dehydrogenase subunit E
MKKFDRVRLDGVTRYRVKEVRCEKCGRAIIKDHEAMTPIYYTDGEIVVCVKCAS